MLNITDKAKEEAITPLLRLGFRPFFLLGALYAFIAIPVWIYAYQNGQPAALGAPALWWHAHEMLFGFSMAIVAGFALTAVQNWTGVNGTKGARLGVIVALWLAPRILFWTPAPLWLISIIESLFLLAVAYEMGIRVYKSKGWRNLFFVPLFILAIIANFASYATIKGVAPFTAMAVWQAMLWWFMLLLSVMGGRVIPFFTSRRMQFDKPQPILWIEVAGNFPLVLLFVLSFFPLTLSVLETPLLVWAGCFQLIKVLRWKPWKTWGEPLVWSLHLSYLCIPAYLLLKGLTTNAWLSHTSLHLFAIGAIAGLILAMITRVTMGHTGRNIYQGPQMRIAFASLILSALIRSIGIGLYPEYMMQLLDVATVLWMLSFGMYLLKFGKMLMTPRSDGHPG
ncbi:short-chain dehydrogenase [Vibrio sp. UCD-FRSSP16_10]|uniref:NnrS family protein n=1 Tax=unclassified Vibrio TaxID=2614977 RepID=UPI0007FD91B8|nr:MULTISPECIES: NnrS family protein [unclassified Vibrio]OBT13649.1 short-chain dehydrogenase [Vibrio sp. UCD-FRSSP16_30]OBT19203.1 short-chain dehydrogenase [Vibrio sp. UCD-FRSSP16_10]